MTRQASPKPFVMESTIAFRPYVIRTIDVTGSWHWYVGFPSVPLQYSQHQNKPQQFLMFTSSCTPIECLAYFYPDNEHTATSLAFDVRQLLFAESLVNSVNDSELDSFNKCIYTLRAWGIPV